MTVYKVTDKDKIAPLFDGWEETMVWSCLQDCMGVAYADSLQTPSSAQISLGGLCFFAGEANDELAGNRPDNLPLGFATLVPRDEGWEKAIERRWGEQAVRCVRYATKKEPDVFDEALLAGYVARLPREYELKLVDEALYERILTLDWARDFCANYSSYGEYRAHGLGVVALKDGVIVAGASSYTYYRGGIEIQIDTREDQRRKGLALACGAALILECLKRNWYPSWDAYSRISLDLSQKLGYHFAGEYTVYEVEVN